MLDRELRIDLGIARRMVTRERVEPGPPALGHRAPAKTLLLVLRQRELLRRHHAFDGDGLVAYARETGAREARLRERDRGGPIRVEHRVQRELRRVHARAAPGRAAHASRLVVDHDEGAAHVVHPIDAQAQLQPADVPGHLALGLDDVERLASPVECQQAIDRAELPVALECAGARTDRRGRDVGERAIYGVFRAAPAGWRPEREQRRLRAEPGPEPLQRSVQNLPAQAPVESRLRLLEWRRVQPQLAEGAERTTRLQLEQACPAPHPRHVEGRRRVCHQGFERGAAALQRCAGM